MKPFEQQAADRAAAVYVGRKQSCHRMPYRLGVEAAWRGEGPDDNPYSSLEGSGRSSGSYCAWNAGYAWGRAQNDVLIG